MMITARYCMNLSSLPLDLLTFSFSAVPNTQFGVPYVEFTSTEAALGQTATFQGGATHLYFHHCMNSYRESKKTAYTYYKCKYK